MTELASLARDALRIYLSCLWNSLLPSGSVPPLRNPRRLVFCCLFLPAFLTLQFVHWLFLFLDEFLFPDYRKTTVKNPVWITGIPRSGTTFLHRLLAGDKQSFTTLTTWECLLAPSITQKRLFLFLNQFDRGCGSPVRGIVEKFISRMAGPLREIHEISPSAPEEDYLALLPAAGCFFSYLAFPFCSDLRNLARLEHLSETRRNRLINFYHLLLQKHLFVSGQKNRRLLSKNAAFASWVPFLARRYPDARFILAVRDPQSAIPSQVSSIRDAQIFFGIPSEPAAHFKDFADLFTEDLSTMKNFMDQHPDAGVVVIDMHDLKSHPARTLHQALNQLQIPVSGKLALLLEDLKPGHRSGHRHSWPEDIQIDDCLQKKYRQVLELPQRIRGI